MSTSPTQPEASDAEELVAYLDGELSADECRRVERRLASDAAYRRRLTELEQAWSALDALPSTAVNDDFARTTIEMVAVAAEKDIRAQSAVQAATGRRRAYWLAAGGLAITLAAFAAAPFLAPDSNRRLIADLPVITRLNGLMEIGDVAYLRSLSALDFGPPSSAEDGEQALLVGDLPAVGERRQWVESLPAGQKAELAADFARFERLTPENRDRLRDLDRQIAAAPDRAQLVDTLGRYSAWVQRLTSGQQLQLRQASPAGERLELARRLLAQTNREARRRLSADDKKALRDEIQRIAAPRRGELVQEFRSQGHTDPEQWLADRSPAEVSMVVLMRDLRNDERRRQLQDRLTAVLSPEAREYFERLEGPQRGWQLWRWIIDAMEPRVSPQNLEQYFVDGLTNDQREYLLSLPLTEMEQQLQQMYMWSQVGLRDDDWPRRFLRGGPGGRGPWDPNRGPNERGRRNGPRSNLEGPPFPPGPGGRGGRPPGPPPRDDRGWGPPSGPPPPDGPPSEGRPVESGPPPEQPI